MNSTKHSLAATVKVAGVAAALILGLTLSTSGAAAHARTAGPDATPVAHHSEPKCDKDQVVEAALHAAAKQVQRAFTTNHLAIEQLREQGGERNNAARDLLKQADSELKGIRATAKAALDAVDESVVDESVEDCTTVDTATVDGAAIEAIVAQATADMEAVVTEVTAAVAALPATDVKSDDEDNDEDNADEDTDEDHETKSADHETKSGEKSTVNATAMSRGHSKH